MEPGSPKGELSHTEHQLGYNYNRKIGFSRQRGKGYNLRSLGGKNTCFGTMLGASDYRKLLWV